MSNIDSFIHDEAAHNEAYARVTCPHCLEECDSVEECENCTKDGGELKNEFIAEVYELCFGFDAINRGFSDDEALKKIREFSDKALAHDMKGTPCETCQPLSAAAE